MRKKEGLRVCWDSSRFVYQPSVESLFRIKEPERGSVSLVVETCLKTKAVCELRAHSIGDGLVFIGRCCQAPTGAFYMDTWDGGCLVNYKLLLKEEVIFKKNTNILISPQTDRCASRCFDVELGPFLPLLTC